MNLQAISTTVGIAVALLAIPKAVAGLVPPGGTQKRLEFWNEALAFPLMEGEKKEKILLQRDQRLAALYAKHWAGPTRRTNRVAEVAICVFIFGASCVIPFMENSAMAITLGLVILEFLWILGAVIFASISVKIQQGEAKKCFLNGKINNPSPTPGSMQQRVKKLRAVSKFFTWFEAILEGLPVMFSGLFVGLVAQMVVAQNAGQPFLLIATWVGFSLFFVLNVFLGKSLLLARYKKMLISDIVTAARASRAP